MQQNHTRTDNYNDYSYLLKHKQLIRKDPQIRLLIDSWADKKSSGQHMINDRDKQRDLAKHKLHNRKQKYYEIEKMAI